MHPCWTWRLLIWWLNSLKFLRFFRGKSCKIRVSEVECVLWHVNCCRLDFIPQIEVSLQPRHCGWYVLVFRIFYFSIFYFYVQFSLPEDLTHMLLSNMQTFAHAVLTSRSHMQCKDWSFQSSTKTTHAIILTAWVSVQFKLQVRMVLQCLERIIYALCPFSPNLPSKRWRCRSSWTQIIPTSEGRTLASSFLLSSVMWGLNTKASVLKCSLSAQELENISTVHYFVI